MKELKKELKSIIDRLGKAYDKKELTYEELETEFTQYVLKLDREFLNKKISKEQYLGLSGMANESRTKFVIGCRAE